MRNIIRWHRWHDPIAELVYEEEEEGEGGGCDDDDEEEDGPPWGENKGPSRAFRRGDHRLVPMLMGPQGPVPVTVHALPSSNFNFWMGHTDFDLTERFVDAAERVRGVETLDVLTRYRFRLGVGEAFHDREVRAGLECLARSFDSPSPAAGRRGGAGGPRRSLSGRLAEYCRTGQLNLAWAVYRTPDGRMDIITGDDKDQVMRKLGRIEGAEICERSWRG